MRNIVMLGTALAYTLLASRVGWMYCKKITRDPDGPSIATWIIVEIGVLMSFASYLTALEHNLVKGIANATDVFLVSAILTTLIVKRWGNEWPPFSLDEKLCFAAIALAFTVWIVSQNAWAANLSFQFVMIVAYWPTIRKLREWPRKCPGKASPEPFQVWTLNVVAALDGSCTALVGRDNLAAFYPLRAAVICGIIAFLAKRIEWKNAVIPIPASPKT